MDFGPADVAVLHCHKVNAIVSCVQDVAVLNVHALHLVHLQEALEQRFIPSCTSK
jgi:hypothetical protein